MGYKRSDTINPKDNAKLKSQVNKLVREEACSYLALASKSGIPYGRLVDWIRNEPSCLSIVDYGKLWLAVNPEEDEA